MPYIFIPIVGLFFTLLFYGNLVEKDRVRGVLVLSFTAMLLMFMFRATSVGYDIANYLNMFEEYGNMSWIESLTSRNVENLFGLFNKILYTISSNYNWYIVATSIITIVPIMVTYAKHVEEYPLLNVMLFLGLDCFVILVSGIRQSIAMAICFAGYPFIKEKKWIKYILAVIFATQFHISAVIALVVPILYNINFKKNWLYFIIPLFILIFSFRMQIMKLLVQFAGLFNPRYATYLPIDTGAYSMLVLHLITVSILFVIKTDNKELVGLRNIELFILFMQIFVSVNYVVARLNYYFIVYYPLIISKMVQVVKEKDKGLAVFIYIGFFLVGVLMFAKTLITQRIGILPYESWLY